MNEYYALLTTNKNQDGKVAYHVIKVESLKSHTPIAKILCFSEDREEAIAIVQALNDKVVV